MWLGHERHVVGPDDKCGWATTEGSVLCGAKRDGDAGYFVMAHAHRIAHRLRAGTVWINCYNICYRRCQMYAAIPP